MKANSSDSQTQFELGPNFHSLITVVMPGDWFM